MMGVKKQISQTLAELLRPNMLVYVSFHFKKLYSDFQFPLCSQILS